MEERIKKHFDDYVFQFDMEDFNIAMKYYHSYRVMNLSQWIASKTNFPKVDYNIAKIVGLLHDYGRFSQWKKYRTYSDLRSVDHAELGIDLLFKKEHIKKFWSNEEDYDEIYDAILYHNKYDIPNDLSEHNRSLCKIIRDADKLDILYLITNREIQEKETSAPISEEVKKSFLEKRQVLLQDVHNSNDVILTHIAFVFDLNYKCSFEYLKRYQIIEKIYEQIQNKNKFEYYFKTVMNFIEEKVMKDVR